MEQSTVTTPAKQGYKNNAWPDKTVDKSDAREGGHIALSRTPYADSVSQDRH